MVKNQSINHFSMLIQDQNTYIYTCQVKSVKEDSVRVVEQWGIHGTSPHKLEYVANRSATCNCDHPTTGSREDGVHDGDYLNSLLKTDRAGDTRKAYDKAQSGRFEWGGLIFFRGDNSKRLEQIRHVNLLNTQAVFSVE
jgi:hypothetical protein